ncbi:MAG: S24 family peptidase [Bacilli bacterium]|nr:S24 family peptidase [Bacilli bacterium]
MALKTKLSKEKTINLSLNILIGLFSIILLISIYTGVQIRLLNHDYANFFGYSMFEVQTDSMEETISAGDWIIVKLNSKIKLNDIITFKVNDDYITHRVVEIHSGTYITMGDANSGKDDPVDQSQVVGKVTKTLPGFGIFRKTLFNPAVLVMLIIILYLVDSLTKGDKSTKTYQKIKSIALTIWSKLKKLKDNKIKKENLVMPELNPLTINEDVLVVSEPENIIAEEDLLIVDEDENTQTESDKIIVDEVIDMPEIEMSEITELEMPEETDEEELEEDFYEEDELDKTQFFRIIPVDEDEIDSTLLEIASYEMADSKKEQKDSKEEPEIIIEEEEESLTKIDLDLIRNNTRNNKNLIDAIMNIKKDEINEVLDALLQDEKLVTNEATIRSILITTYIHARYYNYYSEKDLDYKGKNLLVKIEKILNIIADEMIKEYDSSDNKYEEKVKKYVKILKTFAKIDQGKDISEIKPKREFYRKTITEFNKKINSKELEIIVNDIIKIQKSYQDITKYFLKKFESNEFYLDINKIKNNKNLYTAEIEHNINFSKVYSDYIIDKTYSEGIISEDKAAVLFVLLLTELINDMINIDFNKKYIIHISPSLFTKEKKLTGLLNAIEDEYAKAHILFLIDFEDLIKNKKVIQRFKKKGFRFATGFKNPYNLAKKDRGILYMVETIFTTGKDNIAETIENYVPKDLQHKIIYDNIYDKFNIMEGE